MSALTEKRSTVAHKRVRHRLEERPRAVSSSRVYCSFLHCSPKAVLRMPDLIESLGSGLCCGMAMSHVPAGESPAQITASHGSGIEPCRFAGNGGLDA